MPNNVVTSGIYPTVNLYPSQKAETGRMPSRLHVEVDVSDSMVKRQVHGADDFERVTVGVPYRKGGKVAWKEVALPYEGREIRGYYARELVDSHETTLSNVNASLVKSHGVYVKLEYGDGSTVVWGQEFGKNHKPANR